MDRPASRSRAPMMSLESALDEENREVLAQLERESPNKRTSSPFTKHRTATPPPRIRSMLDVDAPTHRHGSIAGIGVGVTSPSSLGVTSPSSRRGSRQLDPSDPSSWTSPATSKPSSPELTKSSIAVPKPRSSSEADRPVGLPKIHYTDKPGFEQSYQFDMASMPSSGARSVRSPHTSPDTKRPREGSSTAMAAAMSGDLSSLYVGQPLGVSRRHESVSSSGAPPRSPTSPKRTPESSSTGLLSPTGPPAPAKITGTAGDSQAHRRLSNKSSSFSTVTDDSEDTPGRIVKDGVGEEDAVESSDDDARSTSSDDEDRGRPEKRKTSESELPQSSISNATPAEVPEPDKSATQAVKSLLEPSISVTSPTGESISTPSTPAAAGVTPSTNFVSSAPASTASVDSDDEESAIQKAKSLALNVSPLDHAVKNRHVRIVLRGDWARFHAEAEAGKRTNRTYLVCSDLSTEAMYAMEWTVGTMLRDGDTLLAIYAIEDETANDKISEGERDILTAQGAKAGAEASDAMNELTRQTTQGGGTSLGLDARNRYIPATEVQSLTGSVDARSIGKKEMERLRAIDEITQNFIRLVRKTTLQVRCFVEVIHCQSPKHLILGAIDELEPTLCVVGTRGRSSLKGVLLGSFSNYLVTKSSVPVMVARKRLKKPRSQVRVSSTKIRLSNNLTPSSLGGKRKSLTQARID